MKENPRYTNFTTLTKERFLQFRKIDFRQENAVLWNTTFICILLYAAFTIVLLCTKGLSVWFFLNLIVILAVAWILLFGYRFKAQEEYERFQSVRGKNPNITYEFYEEYVQMETEKSKVRINYSQVEKMIVTNELYILKVGSSGIIINKDGFMIGNIKNFKEFIESRIGSIK